MKENSKFEDKKAIKMPDYLGTDQRKVAKKDDKEEKIEGEMNPVQMTNKFYFERTFCHSQLILSFLRIYFF